ncbi:3290_t:CDS:2 [Diversispora eburnea]|uniref:3290_t:CDS:1 n=1 Tax=Diversispora eburnea TaxID=1213867 RepID=A0A9N9F8G0_9GLOM|nr:3290_t:CDS:2 [Diversispora eburnea]
MRWLIILLKTTQDSSSVRKAHNNGKNHIMNVRNYYAELGQDKAQAIIDEITKAYERAGQSGFPPQYGYAPGVPPVSPAAAPVATTPYGGPVVPPIMMGRTAGNIPPGTVPGPAPGIGAPPPGLGGPAPGTIPQIPSSSSSQPVARPPSTAGQTPQPFGGPPSNNNFIRSGQTPGFQPSQGNVSQPPPGPL